MMKFSFEKVMYFYISLCVTKRHFECVKSSWKSSGNKAFFGLSNYFDREKCASTQQTFFFIAWNHLYHLLITLKVQNCHEGKKGRFSPVTRWISIFDKMSLGRDGLSQARASAKSRMLPHDLDNRFANFSNSCDYTFTL